MQISKKIWVIIAILVVFVGLGSWTIATKQDTSEEATTIGVVDEEIHFSEDGKVVSYKGVVGETALDTLKALTDVRVQESDFGEFVTGIGEVDAEGNKNFWAFYVNGEQAQVGAGDYVAQEGDQIEWRIEDIIF